MVKSLKSLVFLRDLKGFMDQALSREVKRGTQKWLASQMLRKMTVQAKCRPRFLLSTVRCVIWVHINLRWANLLNNTSPMIKVMTLKELRSLDSDLTWSLIRTPLVHRQGPESVVRKKFFHLNSVVVSRATTSSILLWSVKRVTCIDTWTCNQCKLLIMIGSKKLTITHPSLDWVKSLHFLMILRWRPNYLDTQTKDRSRVVEMKWKGRILILLS